MATGSTSGPLKQIGITAFTFFIVENAFRVGKLLAVGWTGLNGGERKDPYVIEMGLIAMGIGVTVSVLIALRRSEFSDDTKWPVLTGALVGVLSVLMEILEVIGEDAVREALSWRPLYFLAVYIAAFLVPALLGAVATQVPETGRQRISLIGWAFLVGGFAALIGENLLRVAINHLPIFDYNGSYSGAVDDLTFRPAGLIWSASVWSMICLLPWRQSVAKESAWTWASAYLSVGALFAAGYGLFFIGEDDVARIDPFIPITLGFVILALAPISASVLLLRDHQTSFGRRRLAIGLAFVVTGLAMGVTFAKGVGTSTEEAIAASLLMGFAGALVPLSVLVADRFSSLIESGE